MDSLDSLLEAVQTYFDSLYFCDVEKLNSVFHESSSLFDADNGKVFVEPIASFMEDVSGRVSPASKNQDREEEVLMIDYLSPISAVVKIRLRAHENVFVDHLSFVKGARGWKIVAKVWHLEKVVDTH